MKLYSAILEKFFDLPSKDPAELRPLLDDLGLEVKDVETPPHGAVYTIETLANRGDHLHALGVARELSGRLLSKIKHPPVSDLPDRKASVPVRKNTPQCMRYALLEMTIPKAMPLRDDIGAITGTSEVKHSAIVDILNYVALELGQPMHAFDKDKIDGEIIIDLTDAPTTVEALDGKTYTVPANSIVIRDKKKIVAVAGVIGCSNSMVTADTTRILIESASFDPVHVRKTARAMGISTDASYTFERGCDIDMVIPALKRAVYLAQAAGGEGAHVIGLQYAEGEPTEKRKITLRLPFLKEQVNLPRLPDIEITTRLKNLGFGVDATPNPKEVSITVPSWRLWDVKTEEDLVEDFARSHGLNNIKIELPPLDYEIPPYNDTERVLSKIESSLVGNGFYEVITRSFYSADDVSFLESLEKGISGKHVTLKNSLESAYSHLKNTNILHFAALAAQNMKMNVQSFKIFEYGRLFSLEDASKDSYERDALCMAVCGRWYENEWKKGESTADLFYLTKGVIESIFASFGREIYITEGKNRFLHPGFQGTVIAGRETVGFFGVAHPKIKSRYELRSDLVYAEFDGARLAREIQPEAFSLPVDFPTIKRDITLMIGLQDLAGKVLNYVDAAKVENLVSGVLVDDFRKDSEDFRRATYRLTFQNPEKTLEHAEVDQAMEKLLSHLKEKHSLELAK